MKSFETITGERVVLRIIDENDANDFFDCRSHDEVARYQYWEPFSMEKSKSYIAEKCGQTPEDGKWFQLGIADISTNRLIGDCAFCVDSINENAEIGFNLNPKYQKRGLAFEAICLLMNCLFDEFGAHRIFAVTDCENAASFKLLEKLGMRREGHFVENVRFKGSMGSEFLYAVLKNEWENTKSN